MRAEKKEAFPLAWPESWPRTRPQDQRAMPSWKRSANDYREELAKELDRSKVLNAVISTNVQLSVRGQMVKGVEPRDVGVAIYFSRPLKEDFRWQEALDIREPAPTEEQINSAYRRRVTLYHPDRPGGGDAEMFLALTKHRDAALAWATRSTAPQDASIACDLFREVRLNLAGIAYTLRAMRTIERCGTSSMLERAFKGFLALAAEAGPDAGVGR